MTVEDVRIVERKSSERDIPDPQLDQIENAIRRMDGKYRTMVILGQTDDDEFDHMIIGGGENGLYRCSVADKVGNWFALIDPNQHSAKYVAIPAGQTTKMSMKEVVDLESVLIAAGTHARTGQRDESTSWTTKEW